MKTVVRVIIPIVVCLVLQGVPLSAQEKQPRVVATNTWTAAIAQAAGAADIISLAPPDLRHPAEYELKPSDIARLKGAGLIIDTGFEVMAKKLAAAASDTSIRVVTVDADYSLATMRTSIMAIAAVLGTEPVARENVAALEGFMARWKSELQTKGLVGAPIVAHVFQLPLLKELGFSVKGTFGPGPLEAAQITKLSPIDATLVVDNWHNEAAGPLKETMKSARFVSLINFPGPDGTVTLLDVLADNRKRLEAALE